MEHGPRTIHAGYPSCLGRGVGEQSYSDCLAFTVFWGCQYLCGELAMAHVSRKMRRKQIMHL